MLAIFELANCFRHGWGVGKDPVAAKQYYETAANLGDTDAMNEVGWCYLEGFGGRKDKVCCFLFWLLFSLAKTTGWGGGELELIELLTWRVIRAQYTAAKYYRLAEQSGSKTLGNSWSVLFLFSSPFFPLRLPPPRLRRHSPLPSHLHNARPSIPSPSLLLTAHFFSPSPPSPLTQLESKMSLAFSADGRLRWRWVGGL